MLYVTANSNNTACPPMVVKYEECPIGLLAKITGVPLYWSKTCVGITGDYTTCIQANNYRREIHPGFKPQNKRHQYSHQMDLTAPNHKTKKHTKLLNSVYQLFWKGNTHKYNPLKRSCHKCTVSHQNLLDLSEANWLKGNIRTWIFHPVGPLVPTVLNFG